MERSMTAENEGKLFLEFADHDSVEAFVARAGAAKVVEAHG